MLRLDSRSFALAACLSVLAATAQAKDETQCPELGCFLLAADGNYASAMEHDMVKNGGGGALRIGLQRTVSMVTFVPELMVDYHVMDAITAHNAKVTTVKVGGRVRFLTGIEPGLFAHFGGGHIGGNRAFHNTDSAYDFGLSLDFTMLPLIDLGVHAAWNRILGGHDGGISFGTMGVHVSLVL